MGKSGRLKREWEDNLIPWFNNLEEGGSTDWKILLDPKAGTKVVQVVRPSGRIDTYKKLRADSFLLRSTGFTVEEIEQMKKDDSTEESGTATSPESGTITSPTDGVTYPLEWVKELTMVVLTARNRGEDHFLEGVTGAGFAGELAVDGKNKGVFCFRLLSPEGKEILMGIDEKAVPTLTAAIRLIDGDDKPALDHFADCAVDALAAAIVLVEGPGE
jgi:hypothetical protein